MEGEGDEKRLGERQRGRETGRNKKTETEMGQRMLEKDKTEGKQTDGLRKEGSDVRWGKVHWDRQPPVSVLGSPVCSHRRRNMSPPYQGMKVGTPFLLGLNGLEPRGMGCQKQSLQFPAAEHFWPSKQ